MLEKPAGSLRNRSRWMARLRLDDRDQGIPRELQLRHLHRPDMGARAIQIADDPIEMRLDLGLEEPVGARMMMIPILSPERSAR